MPASIDHTGSKFGRLTAVERIAEKYKATRYRCVCDCGSEITVPGCALVTGNTSSCGCQKKEATVASGLARRGLKKHTHPDIDMTGMVFGRLTIDGFSHKDKHNNPVWRCVCSCGTIVNVVSPSLKDGRTTSCGCFRREEATKKCTTHGLSDAPEYGPWQAMWSRCTNPNQKSYGIYKDRTPPEEWRDFLVFKNDIGDRPSPKHSIDRIDNNKPYGPGNCRWATSYEQSQNTSRVTKVLYQGNVMTLRKACEDAGVDYGYISGRKQHYKDVEKASNGLFKKVA